MLVTINFNPSEEALISGGHRQLEFVTLEDFGIELKYFLLKANSPVEGCPWGVAVGSLYHWRL